MDGVSPAPRIENSEAIAKIAHTIPLSMGQFALSLGGYKHLHYMHLDQPYAKGTKLLLSCNINGETANIPIIVKKCEPAPKGELTNGNLGGAGYYLSTKEIQKGKIITAAEIADTSLHSEGQIYSVDFAIDTRRDLTKSDLQPQNIRRLQREALHQLQHSYELLEPQVSLSHSAFHRAFPPRDTRGDDFDKDAYFAGADESMMDAFLYLRKTGSSAVLLPFLRSLARPHESLSQQLKNDARANGKPGSSEPNEFGAHQHELAGFTHIYTDQGSGMLAAMGLKNRIALRGPLLTYTGSSTNGDNEPQTSAVIAVDYKEGNVNRVLTVPVIIDRSDAPTMYANQITDEIAHMHGHKNIKAMRQSLRISDTENPILYSYAFRLATPEELIWFDQKGEDVVMNMTQAFHDIWANSKKDSVRSAKNFMQQNIPQTDQEAGLKRITPFREIRDTEQAHNHVGPNGRRPQSSVAFRDVIGVDIARVDHRASHEKLRGLLGQKEIGRT